MSGGKALLYFGAGRRRKTQSKDWGAINKDPIGISSRRVFYSRRHRRDNDLSSGNWLETEGMRRRAIDAAIAAYEHVLRLGDAEGRACRAALRAYLTHCPNSKNASDEVVQAIISALGDRTKQM
jgi:hypothetical protein